MAETPVAVAASSALKLRRVAAWRGIRVLAWDGDVLYGCRGYKIVRLNARLQIRPKVGRPQIGESEPWEVVARFRPVWWRNFTSRIALSYRLMRDGFHALVVLDEQTMVGAVPGALVTRAPGSNEFHVTHQVQRGTRPLHVTAVPSGKIYWGEYFDNRERAEVHIYVSTDRGRTWQVAYTFPAGSIRHVHNIVYDRWGDCLWILTGDNGAECKVLRASSDLLSMERSVEVVLAGNQQARSVAAIPTQNGLYLATDTPYEKNHVYWLDRTGNVEPVADLASSSIFGCRVAEAIVFSTMIEPSAVNTSREVHLAGSRDGTNWQVLARWKKDNLPMRYFQYGNAFLPDGDNSTRYLAATTIAVETDDLVTTLWEVESA
ncbi:MAG: hypothetical protein WA718_07675 [Terriglobales bacterium]